MMDDITSRLEEIGYKRAEIEKFIEEYLAIPITLDIEDEPVRRISQVLTNNGYRTIDSCEGVHRNRLPHINFFCEDQSHVRHLAHILIRESCGTNFKWELTAYSPDPGSHPDYPLNYILGPERSQGIDPKRDGDKLKQDLDILGIYVMDYFNREKAYLEKEERGLRPISERIKELSDKLFVDVRGFTFPIKPQVLFIWGGEQEDYEDKGTILEEFLDGFEVQTDQDVPEWYLPVQNHNFRVNEGYRLTHLVCDAGLVYSFPRRRVDKNET